LSEIERTKKQKREEGRAEGRKDWRTHISGRKRGEGGSTKAGLRPKKKRSTRRLRRFRGGGKKGRRETGKKGERHNLMTQKRREAFLARAGRRKAKKRFSLAEREGGDQRARATKKKFCCSASGEGISLMLSKKEGKRSSQGRKGEVGKKQLSVLKAACPQESDT